MLRMRILCAVWAALTTAAGVCADPHTLLDSGRTVCGCRVCRVALLPRSVVAVSHSSQGCRSVPRCCCANVCVSRGRVLCAPIMCVLSCCSKQQPQAVCLLVIPVKPSGMCGEDFSRLYCSFTPCLVSPTSIRVCIVVADPLLWWWCVTAACSLVGVLGLLRPLCIMQQRACRFRSFETHNSMAAFGRSAMPFSPIKWQPGKQHLVNIVAVARARLVCRRVFCCS